MSLSRASIGRLTQQSLKRVGHEGKPCLKGEQRPPCLVRSLCLSLIGVIGVTRTGYITELYNNLLYKICGVHTSRQLTPSHHTTPQAPLNHSGVCLCDLMFGQVLSVGYQWRIQDVGNGGGGALHPSHTVVRALGKKSTSQKKKGLQKTKEKKHPLRHRERNMLLLLLG